MQTLLLSVIVTIVALFQTCCCVDQSSVYSCGEAGLSVQIRVTNGWETDSAMWPWHAAIFRRGNDANDYICGATLVGRSFVVTAAHCVVSRATGIKLKPNLLTVHFARQYLNESSERVQERPVKEVIIHLQFVHVGLKNDIALLSLKTEVQFNEYVLPVCLDKLIPIDMKNDVEVGKDGVIVGWGKTENGHVSMTLQTARLPVIDRIACLNSDPQFFSHLISYGMFCAGYENGTSVCNGDSGSGMFFREGEKWMLGGIVSFSGLKADKISCDFHKYAGFTNVRYYVPWIRTIVNDRTSMIFDASDMGSPSSRHLCTRYTEHYDCQIQNVHLKNGQFYDFGLKRNPQRKLTFQDSTLEYLPKSLIDAFPNVTLVNLNDLMITSIESNAFVKAANLQTIYLEGNRLINIDHDAFSGANKLQVLILSKNEIIFFDYYALYSNTDLQYLYLDLNQLYALPRFTYTAKLNFLNVSHNNLESISDIHFRNQRNLKTLDVSFNRLKRLNLQQLDADLDLVDVSSNDLTDFTMPTHVTRLNVRNNALTEFVVGQQCSLKLIDLSQNKLENQPELGTCNSLEHLDLSYNFLEAFEIQTSMAKLQILNIRHNYLFEINLRINPPRISLTFSLKALDLSHNRLSEGPSLSAFKKLQTVFLNDNFLMTLKSYANELHSDFKDYRMANNEWSCAEIPKFQNWAQDKDNDYCKSDTRNVSGFCCRDYSSPYNDLLNEILRAADFHERKNKKRCPNPVAAISNQIDLDEPRNAIVNVNTEEANKIKEIKRTRIQAYNSEQNITKIQTNLNRLYSSKHNIALEIERQRQKYRVTREELIAEKEMLERIFTFVQDKDAYNNVLLARRKIETHDSYRLLGKKHKEIQQMKKNIESLHATHAALKREEKDKKKLKDKLQRDFNKISAQGCAAQKCGSTWQIFP